MHDDGILSQTDNAAHFLGLEHVQKNVEEFLKRFPFLLNVSGAVVEDIFGETGLFECESEEDFTSQLREQITEWDLQKYVNANFNWKLLFNNNPVQETSLQLHLEMK